ncbi:chaperonin 10-like protein [Xylogone sp. PMI_703]|nr:chaperonin 10-like protein [Xylogone sp. PMI_703]
MKGVIVPKAGAPFELVDNLIKPSPGKGEVLVRSLATGINPMENLMQNGLLVDKWPTVLGCDASGVVVSVGEGVTKFAVGDAVFGCTKFGGSDYMTFQEYFLMSEPITFKRPEIISVEQAATVGVAALTASLGLVTGAGLELAAPDNIERNTSEWLIILGGASSVGQFGIQIAKLNGFKILASCSPHNNDLVKRVGADATFDYKTPVETQLATIEDVTKGNFSVVFDGSAQTGEFGLDILQKLSKAATRSFATPDGWSTMDARPGIRTFRISLGELGRSGNANADLTNTETIKFIPKLEKLLATGALKPLEYVNVGGGFEGIFEGLTALGEGRGRGRKIVVRLQVD